MEYGIGVVGEEHCAGRRIRLAAASMLICPRANDCMLVGITLKLVATQHPEPRDDIEGLVIPFAQRSPIAPRGALASGRRMADLRAKSVTSEVYKPLKGRPRNTLVIGRHEYF